MADATIRDYRASDAEDLNRISVAAFSQFRDCFLDWPAMHAIVSTASALSETGEVIVAECHGRLAGGVAYIGPNVAKAPFFNRQWPVVRMLVVDPDFRGKRIGHTLTAECIARAKRDNS